MSTQKRKDERDAKTFRNPLRPMQLCVLAFFFGLSRQVFLLFEQRRAL